MQREIQRDTLFQKAGLFFSYVQRCVGKAR